MLRIFDSGLPSVIAIECDLIVSMGHDSLYTVGIEILSGTERTIKTVAMDCESFGEMVDDVNRFKSNWRDNGRQS